MAAELQDSTVVVTGAGKGIGLAVAEALAAAGPRWSRPPEPPPPGWTCW
ncbi:hypothetical protein ABZ864_21285 [Streptomyces sp. NPDC047082]